MKNEVLFCPLGGAGEIGMNMYLYAYGKPDEHKWIIVDSGVTFADDSVPGIDLIFPDFGFIEDKKDNILGIVLTHAHEDHIGAVTYVWSKLKCKIYATPFTAVLIQEKFKEKKIDISNYLKIVDLGNSIKLGEFDIEFITLTHSILEPNGLNIKTPIGNILHTGDWKYDPYPLVGKKLDSSRLEEIGKEGVLTMVCDSTNVFSIGRAGSELDVRKSLSNIIDRLKKKIIVTSFASNVARMDTIFHCAKRSGRLVSLVGRSMYKIFNAARKCGYLKDIDEPVDPRDAKKIARNKIIYLCTGSQGEPMGAMNRVANYTHPDVTLEAGDAVIFSSKIIPGNEKKLYKLHNQLVGYGIEVISEETEFVHVSGHPNRDDLKDMYNWIKPKTIIPVHGEQRHLLEHISFAKEMNVPNTVKVQNGDIVRLSPDSLPEVYDKAPYGKVYLDGKIGIDEDSKSLKERRNLSINGYLNVIVMITPKGNIHGRPIIDFKGLPVFEEEDFRIVLDDEIENTLKTFSLSNKKQENNIIDALKIALKKLTKEKTGKKPITNISIVRI